MAGPRWRTLRALRCRASTARAPLRCLLALALLPPAPSGATGGCSPEPVVNGSCAHVAASAEECTAAGRLLPGIPDNAAAAVEQGEYDRPSGCWWNADNRQLYFNTVPGFVKPCSETWRCVCCASHETIAGAQPAVVTAHVATEITLQGVVLPGDLMAWAHNCTGLPSDSAVDPPDGSNVSMTFTFPSAGTYELCYWVNGGVAFVAQHRASLAVEERCVPELVTAGEPHGAACPQPVASRSECSAIAGVHPHIPRNAAPATLQNEYDRPSGCWWQPSNGHFYFNTHLVGSNPVRCTSARTCVCCSTDTSSLIIAGIAPTSILAGSLTRVTLKGTVAPGDMLAWAPDCVTVTHWLDPADGTNATTVFNITLGGIYKLCYRASGNSDAVEQLDIRLEVVEPCGPDVQTSGSSSCQWPVDSAETCTVVAGKLAEVPADTVAVAQYEDDRPSGCWWQASTQGLFFNMPPAANAPVNCSDAYSCICCLVTSTTTTSTTTSMTVSSTTTTSSTTVSTASTGTSTSSTTTSSTTTSATGTTSRTRTSTATASTSAKRTATSATTSTETGTGTIVSTSAGTSDTTTSATTPITDTASSASATGIATSTGTTSAAARTATTTATQGSWTLGTSTGTAAFAAATTTATTGTKSSTATATTPSSATTTLGTTATPTSAVTASDHATATATNTTSADNRLVDVTTTLSASASTTATTSTTATSAHNPAASTTPNSTTAAGDNTTSAAVTTTSVGTFVTTTPLISCSDYACPLDYGSKADAAQIACEGGQCTVQRCCESAGDGNSSAGTSTAAISIAGPREYLVALSPQGGGNASGLWYRASKRLDDLDESCRLLVLGTRVWGVDEGDGWLRVGDHYLPLVIGGQEVLHLQAAKVGTAAPPALLWVAGPWSLCSEPCRASAEFRVVSCPACYNEGQCERSGPRPPSRQPCREGGVCASTDATAGAGWLQWLALVGTCSLVLCTSAAVTVVRSLQKRALQDAKPHACSDGQPAARLLAAEEKGMGEVVLPETHDDDPVVSPETMVVSPETYGEDAVALSVFPQIRIPASVAPNLAAGAPSDFPQVCIPASLALPHGLGVGDNRDASASEEAPRCPAGHVLESFVVPWSDDFGCDGCLQDFEKGSRLWACGACGCSLCDACCRGAAASGAGSQAHGVATAASDAPAAYGNAGSDAPAACGNASGRATGEVLCSGGHACSFVAGPPPRGPSASCRRCSLTDLEGSGEGFYTCPQCSFDLCFECARQGLGSDRARQGIGPRPEAAGPCGLEEEGRQAEEEDLFSLEEGRRANEAVSGQRPASSSQQTPEPAATAERWDMASKTVDAVAQEISCVMAEACDASPHRKTSIIAKATVLKDTPLFHEALRCLDDPLGTGDVSLEFRL